MHYSHWFLLILCAATLALSGCATTSKPDTGDDSAESEIPWAVPQPWENSISFPGMENR